jgi:acetyl-CoA carboxylase beta subunit
MGGRVFQQAMISIMSMNKTTGTLKAKSTPGNPATGGRDNPGLLATRHEP